MYSFYDRRRNALKRSLLMIHPRFAVFQQHGRTGIQLMFKLRLNYALVSSSLLLGGWFCNKLIGFDWKYVALIVGFFFANVFGFVVNDFFDALSDKKETTKRLRNLFCTAQTKAHGKVVLYVSLGLSLVLGGIVSPHILLFIGLLNILAFCYSAPPIKLRDRLYWDWIFVFFWKGIIIFAGFFHFFGIELSSINPFLFGSIGIVLLISLISQISNQIRDFEVDKKTNIKNTIQKFQRFDIKKLLYTLAALIITGFSIIIFTIPTEYRIINVSISLFIGFLAIYRMNRRAREFI